MSLESWRARFKSWISKVSWRMRDRLYDQDDIQQECYIQLWRCLKAAPNLPESQFEGFFKVCVRNRLADLASRADRRNYVPVPLDLHINLAMEPRARQDRGEEWYQRHIAELIELCDDPAVKGWILDGLGRKRGLQGFSKKIQNRARMLVAACSI